MKLFLEIEAQELVRFVIFIAHPQFFFYHGSGTESGIRFRETTGRKQDSHLAVAGKLGGMETTQGFYEFIHRPALYGQFKREDRELVSRLETAANSQLQKAFPHRHKEIELAAGLRSKDAYDEEEENDTSISRAVFSELIKCDQREEVCRTLGKMKKMAHIRLNRANTTLGTPARPGNEQHDSYFARFRWAGADGGHPPSQYGPTPTSV